MCGITGLINGDKFTLEKMHGHQYNRGHDSDGFYFNDNVGIAHNRLSILDLSENGNQPMETDVWVLAFVGEIYIHEELRRQLNVQWKGTSDTETLLNCIEHKGLFWTIENIQGMYAFAAYNKLTHQLHLIVDHLGIKGLFYCKDGNQFAFASSPGALTHIKEKWDFNEDALIDYLALGATREPLFKGMKRLPAGHMIQLDCHSMEFAICKYYVPKAHTVTPDDLIETVKQSIQSVKVADVPVFMFLSGGVDSSVVASQCEGMTAIHLASPEEQYARQVAEKYHNPFIKIDPRDYKAEECLKDYSLQSGDCSMAALIPYIVSKETSKHCKVAISANGADELFFGYDRLSGDSNTDDQRNHIFRKHFLSASSFRGAFFQFKNSREIELSTYVEYDLNKTLDFASMCHGLEVRVPYLNRTVVEQALSLDWAEHTNRGFRAKAILKKFLIEEGFSVPFVTRPKLGFSLFYEPEGHESLKKRGVQFLKEKFGIDPKLETGRDQKYYAASAASFLCWWETWSHKLNV